MTSKLDYLKKYLSKGESIETENNPDVKKKKKKKKKKNEFQEKYR